MQQLHPDKIELWCAFCDQIADERLLASYRSLLTPEERHRESRFYFARDQHRYLITRALVRTVLSRYVAVAPDAWRFTADQYGRPHIANVDSTAQRVRFNISHTDRLVVLGITCERALGVDTEPVHARRAELQIADRFFSADEVAQLHATPAEHQQSRFFEYWTLKESYIKARGMGLSLPLGQFGFDLSQPRGVRISIDERLNDDPSRWMFWLLRVGADHYVAVGAEDAGGQAPQLICTSVVPLQSEAILEYEMLRRST